MLMDSLLISKSSYSKQTKLLMMSSAVALLILPTLRHGAAKYGEHCPRLATICHTSSIVHLGCFVCVWCVLLRIKQQDNLNQAVHELPT